jgi:hypothetical protein
MTAVQVLALSTPAVIGAALLTLAYWVRSQNRSPVLAESGAAERTSQASKHTDTTAPAPPAEAHRDSLDEMSKLADFEKLTNIKAMSIANLADAERALADLQRFVSTARIASRASGSE